MSPTHRRRGATCAAALGSVCALAVLGAGAALAASPQTTPRPKNSSILSSRDLWATVNVCNPKDMRNTIGIRGSMPGDGNVKEVMYMRFRVQYQDTTTHRWIDVSRNADSGYARVGAARLGVLQAGRSFTFVPVKGAAPFLTRGVVGFQWRLGRKIVRSAGKQTTSPHKSLQGADPRGFTAATCTIG